MSRPEHWGTPDYSAGYFAAVAGSPPEGDGPAYMAGFDAGKGALGTITSAGFVRWSKDRFSAQLTIPGAAQ